MHFEVLPRAERDELSCNMEEVPTDESNLVLRVSSMMVLCLLEEKRNLVSSFF